ncbi:DUF1269 domain-containing protein [Herbiconiux liangxiaofengii]|uniref:DUF1269 domain-containing protein n=1 Tax=Herbiconiux liangxiaofengii TaxID=3342795 RepID=UPI0035BAC28E
MTTANQTTTDLTGRRILAASFPTPDGGARAAAAIAGAFAGHVGNVAILHVKPDGSPAFVETKDWGSGRGALVGGLIGIIGGPLGMLAGSGLGVLATKVRDAGFPDRELTRLGYSLKRNHSALVLEIDAASIGGAERILTSIDAAQVVVEPLDSSVADLFAEEWIPEAP